MLLARNDRGAMETLVKRYTDAVWHQVRQFRGASEPDDLAQEGFLGLISAVCRYDSMRGVPFSAYAGKCITNSIVSALRRCRNLPLPVGTYDVHVEDGLAGVETGVEHQSVGAVKFLVGDVLRNGEPLIPAGISSLHTDLRRCLLCTDCTAARHLRQISG